MKKEKKYTSPMHKLATGVRRGNAPVSMSPEEKVELARRDAITVSAADDYLANLNRNAGKVNR
jgi:hypothetical protein